VEAEWREHCFLGNMRDRVSLLPAIHVILEFTPMIQRKTRYMTHREIQDHVERYIQDKGLAKPQNRAMIRLDMSLAKAIGAIKPKAEMPPEEIALRKEGIVEKMKGEMVEAVRIGGVDGNIR
jgi:hypothetical protein